MKKGLTQLTSSMLTHLFICNSSVSKLMVKLFDTENTMVESLGSIVTMEVIAALLLLLLLLAPLLPLLLTAAGIEEEEEEGCCRVVRLFVLVSKH